MLRPTLSTSLARHALRRSNLLSRPPTRTAATSPAATTAAPPQKRAGDISAAFVSLSGGGAAPLGAAYAAQKARLVGGGRDAVAAAWPRLLAHLRGEVAALRTQRAAAVPEVAFADVAAGRARDGDFARAYRRAGVGVVRGVVDEREARGLKDDVRAYIAANPHTKAFPPDDPQVWEVYWSAAQVRARSHPNLLATQRFLMGFWRADEDALISVDHPVSYADRLRLRQPGDSQFALGPHIDGGSVERWEDGGYGLGGNGKGVYSEIWKGNWEEYDPWDANVRLGVVSDLYQGVGACSMFRMAQGWLSMSEIGAGEGHLMVNPMLRGATAYVLMRPFFEPKRSLEQVGTEDYLKPENWKLEGETSVRVLSVDRHKSGGLSANCSQSFLQGATPGHGQELNEILHPHLDLQTSMVHMPDVRPGDFVAWHCDSMYCLLPCTLSDVNSIVAIHSVDKTHAGRSDSSVLYIPVCPLTEHNAQYLRRQRNTFLNGTPSPDFGGGEGESKHVGRPTVQDLPMMMDSDGLRAMGLMEWDSAAPGLSKGQREVMDRANKELGFYM